MTNALKWICLLLLVVNIGYFGWTLDRRTQASVQQQTQALSISAGAPRLKLISELDHPPLRKRNDAGDAGDTATGSMTSEHDLVATFPGLSAHPPESFSRHLLESLLVPIQQSTDTCFSFGPFAEIAQGEHLLDWFRQRDTRATLRRATVSSDPGREQLLWVYLAPHPNAPATLRKLREQGVNDISEIETGKMRNAISLGLFSNKASVMRRLHELQAMGYQPEVAPYRDDDATFWVDARIRTTATMDALVDEFPSGLSYLPVQCDKIELPEANP